VKRTKIVVDTSAIIAVIAGEAEKPRLIERTQGIPGMLQPEQSPRTSPFDVPSVSFSLTKREILEAIHESRERTPYALQTGQNPQTE
jgi:uncharacterized protein with PIN domain